MAAIVVAPRSPQRPYIIYTVSGSSSSTEEEEISSESVQKKKSSKRKVCYMHISSVKHEEMQDFTSTRWNTYRNSLRQWLELRGECRDVAQCFKHSLELEFEELPDDAAFHPTCYRRFIDKREIERTKRRIVRETQRGYDQQDPQTSQAIHASTTGTTPTRKFRSRSSLPISSSGPVLPAICIICKKGYKFVVAGGRRQKEALTKTKTLNAGKLQEAAEVKDDQSILIHIKDRDCVALQVQYHKSCYRQYTRFLSGPARAEKEQIKPTFDLSYKLFCERVICQRLLINQEVLRMSQLRKDFIDLVQSSEGVDASSYRQDTLKKRLSRDFPQLVFHIPAKHNTSELVFAENLSTHTDLDFLPSGAETTQSSEMSQTDSDTERRTSKQQTTTTEGKRTLYTAALLLKRLLSDSPGMSCLCPPTAENFNLTEAQTVVPLELYNLVSWIVGATEEPTLEQFVNISDNMHVKVLSVCQDIVYLASKGRKQTPRSLC
ncbi:uncharacterized protein LOC143518500 [Brachyhypopomus gauderio]|uniref:uncharacterized protein LOC143518500 n=1 Tax=Brachyhypopomus gauderio TaxID=698409 RepID=UPI0040413CA0